MNDFNTREINIKPWNHLTTTSEWNINEMKNILTLLIEKDGEYYFLVEWDEKIFDVSKMPNYIKEDWIKYNKKSLSLSILNQQIKKLTNDYEQFDDELILLKSLRRELIISGVL
jgi:hypothetical protein